MRKYAFLLLFLVLTLFSTKPVSADMGPKASLDVYIKGVDEDFYFDLLVYVPGAMSTIPAEELDELEAWWYYDEGSFPDVLLTYQDSDGFGSYSVHDVPSRVDYEGKDDGVHHFHMGYIAPREFKIVLVMKDNEAIIVSETINTNRFESTVTWDLTGVSLDTSRDAVGELSGTFDGSQSLGWTTAWLTTLRIFITLVVELGILWLFKIREKRDFVKVGIVNVITQLTLSLLVISAFFAGGVFLYAIALVFFEFIVLAAELIIYMYHFKGRLSIGKITLYTIAANVGSIVFGILIMSLI